MSIFSQDIEANNIGLLSRLTSNLEFKEKVLFISNNLKFSLINNWYFSLIFVIVFTYLRKLFLISYYFVVVFLLFIFIDYTKLGSFISGRYFAILYSFLVLAFLLLIQNIKIFQIILCLFVFTHFGKTFFNRNYSYSKEINVWSDEYKNLYIQKPAKIHPANWQIKLSE